jgi:hypothetical protein
VTNLNGSSHFEEIVEWQPESRVRLRMTEFSPPLCKFASEFEEIWEFAANGHETRVRRSFRLHAKSFLSRNLLWIISIFLQRAISRHLSEMGGK